MALSNKEKAALLRIAVAAQPHGLDGWLEEVAEGLGVVDALPDEDEGDQVSDNAEAGSDG